MHFSLAFIVAAVAAIPATAGPVAVKDAKLDARGPSTITECILPGTHGIGVLCCPSVLGDNATLNTVCKPVANVLASEKVCDSSKVQYCCTTNKCPNGVQNGVTEDLRLCYKGYTCTPYPLA